MNWLTVGLGVRWRSKTVNSLEDSETARWLSASRIQAAMRDGRCHLKEDLSAGLLAREEGTADVAFHH